MSAFGGGIGTGEQLGVFKAPVALAVNDNAILVADQEGNAVTVFEPTEYGALLRAAQSLYLKGDYEEAKDLWKRVLSYDRGSQPAYRGLAMAYYNEGNYKEALKAARIAVDYTVYDLAWQAILSDFFAKNFPHEVFCSFSHGTFRQQNSPLRNFPLRFFLFLFAGEFVLPPLVFPSFHFEDFLFSFMGFPRPSFTFFPVPFSRGVSVRYATKKTPGVVREFFLGR